MKEVQRTLEQYDDAMAKARERLRWDLSRAYVEDAKKAIDRYDAGLITLIDLGRELGEIAEGIYANSKGEV